MPNRLGTALPDNAFNAALAFFAGEIFRADGAGLRVGEKRKIAEVGAKAVEGSRGHGAKRSKGQVTAPAGRPG